ncbi:MAG TPA: DUF3078 domain-containing protein [Caldithrix sp.]|nr:DUF3078 domain-containing protein [Calditrichaceae bacterium]HEM49412.1 DUF3078 domain-containing protein [Caldithrix sp.]
MIVKRITTTFFTVLLFFTFVISQEAEEKKPEYGWKNEGVAGLNFTQNKFDNWTQGGEDSWSWQLDINAKFVNDQEKYNWSNSIKISYGKTKVGDAGARKAADEIKLESVYSYKLGIYVNPYAAVTGLTQFTDGYDYSKDPKVKVSGFMDPGYFTQSAGLGIEPNAHIKTRLGAALKETITSSDTAAIIYADGEDMRVEYGAESVTDINYKFNEILLYTSKLEMFSNLNRIDEIDVTWDNLVSAKLTKYITASLNVKIFYDKDISERRQLKQTLAVGLSYNLF